MDRNRLVARKVSEVFAAAVQRGGTGMATGISNDDFATLDASTDKAAPKMNMVVRPQGSANALGLQMMGVYFAYCGFEPSQLSALVHAVPQDGDIFGSTASDLGNLIRSGDLANSVQVEDMMIEMGQYAAQAHTRRTP
mgnify:CR=1 FL=1